MLGIGIIGCGNISAAYLKLKHQEWNSYCSHFSKWETENTLDI